MELDNIVSEITKLKDEESFNEIDSKFLNIVNYNNSSPFVLLFVLKLTFKIKDFLPRWNLFRDRVWLKLNQYGFNSKFLMEGMYDEHIF